MTATTTLTLVEFLTARLDEDESYARHDETPHSGPGSTARVLREVEAKRRIVDVAAECADGMWHTGYTCGAENGYADILDHLAAVYADHPDYREEWRP